MIWTGGLHTCAVTTSGGVKCWGNNVNGELGNGTAGHSDAAVDVTGMTSGVAAISAGQFHTCALTTAGGVACWGFNTDGQLGDGTSNVRDTPTDVSGLTSGVAAVSAGQFHTCAVTTGGGIKCWGNNGAGQIGDGTTIERDTPVDVSGLTSGVAEVAGGGYHTCAVTTGGGIKCWGDNETGALGDGTIVERHTPVDVSGLTSGVAAVSAGAFDTCAITTAGGVKCWGENVYGQLGDGTTLERHTPVDVSGLTTGVAEISAGPTHTCALTTAGGVKCWGNNGYGQLGDGTTTERHAPVDVSGLTSGVVEISAHYNHTCALTTTGGVKCWGWNADGELGDGTTAERHTPVDVTGLTSGVAEVRAGSRHMCALTVAGGVECWGYRVDGELGDGTTGHSDTAVDVYGLSGTDSATFGDGGGTLTTDSGGGATPTDPVVTSVTTVGAGTVTIQETNVTNVPPDSFTYVGRQVQISAPTAPDASHPNTLVFTADASVVPGDQGDQTDPANPTRVRIFKDGVEVGECPGSTNATPDPCIAARELLPDGDLRITVLSTTASSWNLATSDVAVVVPDAPTNAAANAGNQQATVSWSAPGSDGGAPLTGYTVTASPGGQAASVDGTTTTAVVAGLTNGTTYTFTVVAANAVGPSVASVPSNAVTPRTTPGVPRNVAATPADARATVTWAPPAVARSPPTPSRRTWAGSP